MPGMELIFYFSHRRVASHPRFVAVCGSLGATDPWIPKRQAYQKSQEKELCDAAESRPLE